MATSRWKRVTDALYYVWCGPYVSHYAEKKKLTMEELEYFLEKKYDVTTPNDLGYTVIDYAVMRGEVEQVQLLLKHGAKGNLELHCRSSSNGYFMDILELLIVEASTDEKNRALLALCKNKNLTNTTLKKSLRMFVEHFCNINYERIGSDGRKENVLVLIGENWGVDMWREIMKYNVHADLIPLHYRYFLHSQSPRN